MDIFALKTEEIRGFDAQKARETELDIRKELNKYRLDIYGNNASNSSKGRQLRKSLARIKTVESEKRRQKETK